MFDDQLAKLPTHPPRSSTLLPGLRIRSAFSSNSLFGPVIFVLFFGLLPLLILSSDPKGRLAFSTTGLAQGRVIKVLNLDCPSDAHRLTYAFTPQGNRGEYRSTSSVYRNSSYFSVNAGDSIPIKYSISDPAISVIAGDQGSEPPYFVFLIFPLFGLLFFAPVLAPVLRELLRARRIVKKGFVTEGSIVFVKRRISWGWPGWPGTTASDVIVSYQTPSGASAEANTWCNNEWLLRNLPPGCKVHVAVIPNRPSQGALLEAFAR